MPKKPFHGARVEVFAPGDKKLVALWRSRPIANCEPGHVIPVLSYRDLSAILRAPVVRPVVKFQKLRAWKTPQPRRRSLRLGGDDRRILPQLQVRRP